MNGDAPYLRLEDAYASTFGLDDKHCLEMELRMVLNGQEFYLTPETAAELVEAVKPLADDAGK